MESFKELFTFDNIFDVCIFLAKPLIILLFFRIIISIFTKLADKFLSKSKLDKGIQSFAKSSIKVALWFIGLMIASEAIGLDTTSLVTLFGVVSLALSLAFQNIMTNVFSGITLLWSKPFSIGDYVEIAGVGGTVKDIRLMRTILVTPDKKIESLPNSDVCAGRITNYSLEPVRRIDIKINVSFNSETKAVQDAVLSVIEKDKRVKNEEGQTPTVRLSAYNSNDIEYTIRMWVDNAEYWNVYYDTLENIRLSFIENGIEFSYPHIIVHQEKGMK